jgi:DNA-binding Lrp family transcriptional regulator
VIRSGFELKAYVLINTELGRESEVTEALRGVKEITAIYSLYGVYDVIVEVEAETMDEVKEVVFNHIRRLGHVRNTMTLITYGESMDGD